MGDFEGEEEVGGGAEFQLLAVVVGQGEGEQELGEVLVELLLLDPDAHLVVAGEVALYQLQAVMLVFLLCFPNLVHEWAVYQHQIFIAFLVKAQN